MGLLDSVLSAATLNAQGDSSGGLCDLPGQFGNNSQPLQIAASLPSNEGGVGGLEGLNAKFQHADLGDASDLIGALGSLAGR
jgi:hypothetical protein